MRCCVDGPTRSGRKMFYYYKSTQCGLHLYLTSFNHNYKDKICPTQEITQNTTAVTTVRHGGSIMREGTQQIKPLKNTEHYKLEPFLTDQDGKVLLPQTRARIKIFSQPFKMTELLKSQFYCLILISPSFLQS